MRVKPIERANTTKARYHGSQTMAPTPATAFKITLMITESTYVTAKPNRPDIAPIINVSTINKFETAGIRVIKSLEELD